MESSHSKRVVTERARSRQVAVVVALMLAMVAPKLYAQVRLAVIDMQRAMLETSDGRRAKVQLKRLFESRQETLNQRQEALKREKTEIERQAAVVRGEALNKRMEEYNKRLMDLQQDSVRYQQELQTKEGELMKQILTNLGLVARQIGTSDNYTAILDASAVIWSPSHIDLTDRVIQEYNNQHPATEEPAAEGADAGAPAARPAAPARPAGAAARPAATPARPAANPHPRGGQAE